jgi:hypothetical protein
VSACQAITRAGKRCRGTPKAGAEYCPFHDPNRAEARKKAAQKANAAKRRDPFKAIEASIEDLFTQVLEGKIPTSVGAVCNQLLLTKLRSLEYRRRLRETEELAAELEKLREEFEAREERRRSEPRVIP